MKKSITVIADADALIALVNIDDFHAGNILRLLEKLSLNEAHILIPSTALAEAITTLQRKFSKPFLAKQLLDLACVNNFVIKSVGEEIITNAVALFEPDTSKHNTFFDAIIAACAKYYGANAILSFDTWYRKKGYMLVSDYLDSTNQI